MPKTTPKVKVYSTKYCAWCSRAKEFLTEHQIAYEELRVDEDAKARDEMIEKSGQMGVPVLDINGTIIIGYDVFRIKKALNIG